VDAREARPRLLLELERMESALVRASLAAPDELSDEDRRRLRYVLGFARLTYVGGTSVAPATDGVRAFVAATLRPHLLDQDDPRERLQGARAALAVLGPAVDERRRGLLERVPTDALDAEAGTRVLVSVAGGGGGAGFVYIGAYQRLEEAGLVPSYVIGASIGALLGVFRARARKGDWDAYVALAKSLDRRELLNPLSSLPIRRRHGLPGLLTLRLAGPVADALRNPDGSPLRLNDLDIPYDAVVAGVRLGAFERLPKRFRSAPVASATAKPPARRSTRVLTPGAVTRLWQVAAFFDPRVVKPIVLGADALTADFNAVDAAGFSAAIPGVLHYDADPADVRMEGLLDRLLEREEVAALVDGGVAANVPVELAWRQVQQGRLGTRNAVYLAFDCFHPQWDPRHLWLQPITQAVQVQMARNAPFADWIVRFEPTLSPIDLVPDPERLDSAVEWGRTSIEPVLPLLERLLEPVGWD
jgi:predicted acylesterase/phospholipase RssA